MELRDVLKDCGLIGVISSYKSSLEIKGTVRDLNIKNIGNALKMVGLDELFLDKNLSELTISELWKLELATKLNNEIIIVGNMSSSINYKDQEYIKKLLLKLNNDYNKKIVIIDNNVKIFFNLVKKIFVVKNKKIIYETDDFYDENLYKYTKCPKIIEFINYANKSQNRLIKTVDIYELIKDIYRSVS